MVSTKPSSSIVAGRVCETVSLFFSYVISFPSILCCLLCCLRPRPRSSLRPAHILTLMNRLPRLHPALPAKIYAHLPCEDSLDQFDTIHINGKVYTTADSYSFDVSEKLPSKDADASKALKLYVDLDMTLDLVSSPCIISSFLILNRTL
jgi:hypothetical protein